MLFSSVCMLDIDMLEHEKEVEVLISKAGLFGIEKFLHFMISMKFRSRNSKLT